MTTTPEHVHDWRGIDTGRVCHGCGKVENEPMSFGLVSFYGASESKATHTPGPWFIDQSSRITECDVFAKDGEADLGGELIASAYNLVRVSGSPEANARLIAAAPDLADLVLRTCTHVSHGGPTRAEAEAVLKKAGLL